MNRRSIIAAVATLGLIAVFDVALADTTPTVQTQGSTSKNQNGTPQGADAIPNSGRSPQSAGSQGTGQSQQDR